MPKDPPKAPAMGKDGQPHRDAAPRKQLFFDLCDPEKRSTEDVSAALKLISKFQGHYDVCLGMNERESLHVAKICGAKAAGKGEKMITALAQAIRDYSTEDVLQATHDFIAAQSEEWVNFSRVSQCLYETFYHLKPKRLRQPGKKYKSLLKFLADYPTRFEVKCDEAGIYWIRQR